MTNFLLKYRLLFQQPLPVLWKKARHKLLQTLRDRNTQKEDLSQDKRASLPVDKIASLASLFPLKNMYISGLSRQSLTFIADQNSKGHFSLLGSGWINNTIGAPSFGVEGICYPNELKAVTFDPDGNWMKHILLPAHLDYSKLLWKNILSHNGNYKPIDWQKDFKSGYRFSTKRWHKHQRSFAKQHPGVDIKVPWELGRLQHLPQLALEAYLSPAKATSLILAYRSQLLDFIATNPYNIGVNWSCPMDVGIRVANILLSLEWFLFLDKEHKLLDSFFQEQVLRFALLHGTHIVENFEYREGLTSNHYLGNIAGLTFLSSYLSGTQQLDEWLALSIQEWSIEAERQFLPDGSNFEGSTAYHRLSGEFLVYCTAALHKVGEKRRRALERISQVNCRGPVFRQGKGKYCLANNKLFGKPYYAKIAQMREFALAYTKPCGNIVQIGDNDSGRFFKLSPVGKMTSADHAKKKYENLQTWQSTTQDYYETNELDHASFISAIEGLLGLSSKTNYPFEYTMLQQATQSAAPLFSISDTAVSPEFHSSEVEKLEFNKETTWRLPNIENKDLCTCYFKEFGLIVFRSSRYYISLRVASKEKTKRFNGHKHNDLLSLELQIDGKDLSRDPGTFIYTPFPHLRNQFRNTAAHSVLLIQDYEQNTLPQDPSKLFYLGEEADTEILSYTTNSVTVRLQNVHYRQIRKISIEEERLIVRDQSTQPFTLSFSTYPFSNGYGKRITKEYA